MVIEYLYIEKLSFLCTKLVNMKEGIYVKIEKYYDFDFVNMFSYEF